MAKRKAKGFHNIKPQYLLIIGVLLILGIAAIAGEFLKPSRSPNLYQQESSAQVPPNRPTSVPGQQACWVPASTSCSPGDPACVESKNSGNPRWTQCLPGYNCVDLVGCIKGRGAGYQYQHCPAGTQLVCFDPPAYTCVFYPAGCDQKFPSRRTINNKICPDESGDNKTTYTCQTNCACVLPPPPPVTAIPTKPPQACVNTPVDIILSFDRSTSMGKSKLRYLKKAALAFVSHMESQSTNYKANVRLGAVSWAGNDQKVKSVSLSNDYKGIKKFINGLSNIGGDSLTCIECGLKNAGGLFNDNSRRKILVIMSDGIANRVVESYSCGRNHTSFCGNPQPPTCQEKFSSAAKLHCPLADQRAIARAQSLSKWGISIYAIGYGSKTTPAILESTLTGIAGKNYVYGGTETNWTNVYTAVAKTICP